MIREKIKLLKKKFFEIRNKKTLAVIILVAIAVSISSYILIIKFVMIRSREFKPLPISSNFIHRVNYPNEYWSYMVPDDQASKYVGEIVAGMVNHELKRFDHRLELLERRNLTNTGVVVVFNKSLQWYKWLLEKNASGYAKIISLGFLYASYIASGLYVYRGNITMLNNYILEARRNATMIYSYKTLIERDLDRIYGNISVFLNMKLMSIPKIYESIYSCFRNFYPYDLSPISPSVRNKYMIHGQLLYLDGAMLSYGCAYYYVKYVYPVIHNYTFSKVLTPENIKRYSCNVSINDYVVRINELGIKAYNLANETLNKLYSIVKERDMDDFLRELSVYLKGSIYVYGKYYNVSKPYYGIISKYDVLLSEYTTLKAISDNFKIIIDYYVYGRHPSSSDLWRIYDMAQDIVNSTVNASLRKYNSPDLIELVFLYSDPYLVLDYFSKYISKVSNPYGDVKALVYGYFAYSVIYEYYSMIDRVVSEYSIHC